MMNNYGLTYADYEQFLVLDSIVGSVPMRFFPQEIRYLHRVYNGWVVGTTAAYQDVNKIELVAAASSSTSDNIAEKNPGDSNEMRNVAVLGSDVAEALFPFKPPSANRSSLTSIDSSSSASSRNAPPPPAQQRQRRDFNSHVYIPLSTCRGRYGEKIFIRQSGSHRRTSGTAPGDADDFRHVEGPRRRRRDPRSARTEPFQERLERHRPLDRLEVAERRQGPRHD